MYKIISFRTNLLHATNIIYISPIIITLVYNLIVIAYHLKLQSVFLNKKKSNKYIWQSCLLEALSSGT